MPEVIHFNQASLFGGSPGTIDKSNCIVHGVSLITSGITATGHDLFVDDTAVNTFHEMGCKMRQLPVNLDHGSGIMSMNGYIDNFRKDGDKWRGDWHLLKTHDETPVMLERCERQPGTFGFSLAFSGDKAGVLRMGKKCAHPEALLSADCVVRPAANKSLFSVKEPSSVDTRNKSRLAELDKKLIQLNNNMADQNPNQEPTISDLLERIDQLTQVVQQQSEIQQQLVAHVNGDSENQGDHEPTQEDIFNHLTELNGMTDEQLAEIGISRADVDQAVDQFNSSLDQTQQEEPAYEGTDEGATQQVASVAAGEGGSTALSAMAQKVLALENHIKATEFSKKQNDEIALSNAIEQKMELLANQNKELREFAATKAAEIDALRMAGRPNGRPVGASTASIELAEISQGGSVIEFEKIVDHQFQKLMGKKGMTEIKAKSQAIDFAIKRHPDSYRLYRKRGTPEISFSVPSNN